MSTILVDNGDGTFSALQNAGTEEEPLLPVAIAGGYPSIASFPQTVVQPIPGLDVGFVTIPAGCYAVSIRTANTTVATVFTAFAGYAAVAINEAADINQSFVLQAGDEIILAVEPGDVVHFLGGTGCTGQMFVQPLG